VSEGSGEFAVAGYHHILLAMPAGGAAEARAERFYGGLLGFEVIPKPEALAGRGGRWFRAGPVELHLGVEEPFVPAAKAHPALLIEGLDALELRLTESGVTIERDEQLDGHERFHVRDPFGNRLELIERRPVTPGGPG
jgi:catechol 2,3-dioxygenase-like lactoylglutathione lyase family enzyme